MTDCHLDIVSWLWVDDFRGGILIFFDFNWRLPDFIWHFSDAAGHTSKQIKSRNLPFDFAQGTRVAGRGFDLQGLGAAKGSQVGLY